MRIFIVSAVFPPEPVVSSTTSSELAHYLAAQGHEVSVVTAFPSRPRGRLYPGYRRRLFRNERTPAGFRLVRCFTWISGRSTMWSRFLESFSFGLASGWVVLTARRPDVVYVNTWPIFSAGFMAFIARARGIPVVQSIQDIYPESLVSQGRITPNGVRDRGLRAVERRIAGSSAALVLPAPSFVEVYRQTRRLPEKKLHFVPNWFDRSSITVDDAKAGEFRSKLDIPPEATVILFGGNVGPGAGVETVIESFKFLQDIPSLYFVVAGDGSRLEACRRLAALADDQRIRFYSPWPAAETSPALAAADILILPTQGGQSSASIPSKLIAYMLAARPVLALSLPGSDLAAIIRTSGCGWVTPPDRPAVLAQKIREVLSQPTAGRRSRGSAGREYALANFTPEACLPKLAGIIGQVVES